MPKSMAIVGSVTVLLCAAALVALDVMPWFIAVVGLGTVLLCVAAFVGARKSRAAAERYLRAGPEERAALEERMARDPLADAHMRPLTIVQVALAILGALLLRYWWR